MQYVEQLLNIGEVYKLCDQGNIIVVIEYNFDVIKIVDWIVDLGLEGGSGGGEIFVFGMLEIVVECEVLYMVCFFKLML